MASANDTARDTSHDNPPTLGRVAERAAGELEKISQKLRSQDIDGLVREAESFARSQPIAFFGLAIAAGFLGMRRLTSSLTRS